MLGVSQANPLNPKRTTQMGEEKKGPYPSPSNRAKLSGVKIVLGCLSLVWGSDVWCRQTMIRSFTWSNVFTLSQFHTFNLS